MNIPVSISIQDDNTGKLMHYGIPKVNDNDRIALAQAEDKRLRKQKKRIAK